MEETNVTIPVARRGHEVIELQQQLFVEADLEDVSTEPPRLRVFEEEDLTRLETFDVGCRTRELIRARHRKARREQRARRPRSASPQWSHAGALVRLSHECPALEDLQVMERMFQGGVSFEDIGFVFAVSKWTVMHYLSRYRTLKARAEAIARSKADTAPTVTRGGARHDCDDDPAEVAAIARALRDLDARTTAAAQQDGA